jgi:hypothetical protein
VHQVDRLALRGEMQRLGDRGFAHAVQGGLGLVDDEAHLRLRILDVPVDVHHAGGLLHDAPDLAGEGDALRGVGAVDFGDDRLQHGRAGRHLGDGDGGAVLLRHGGDERADAFGDVVALEGAFALADEVDLDVGDVGAAAQVVVADEAVEIERRGGAGVDLVVAHLGLRAEGGGHLAGDARRLLQRRALGRVDHDLELRLVVEGQHLDLDLADPDEADRREQQRDDHREERPAPGRPVEQRIHDAVVEAGEPVLRGVFVLEGERGAFGLAQLFLALGAALEHADGGPGGDGERDRQREQHRGGRADRDRPHVRAHQAADERHRQDGRDHGPGGEDGRVADLVHRLERDLAERLAGGAGQAHVAHDVFDHDDRVVDQDADREDQREERDAVQRVSVKVEHQQREREGRGDGEQHDERFAPAEEEQDQQGHAEDRDAHVQQQLVALLGGGVAVVAGDGHADVGGQQRALEGVDLGEHVVDDVDGVGAGALGDADRDGGLLGGGGGAGVPL